MWKYNKYNIGEVVGHKEAPDLEFQINDILTSEPEKRDGYLYCCKVIKSSKQVSAPQGWATAEEVTDDLNNPDRPQSAKIFKYAETILFPIRKATSEELNNYLKQAITNEDYEKAAEIKHQLYELKRSSQSKSDYLLELKNDLVAGAKVAYSVADKIDDTEGSPNHDAVKIKLKNFRQKSIEEICQQAELSYYKHKGYFFLSANRPWQGAKNTTFIQELEKYLDAKGHEVYTYYQVD